MSKVFASIGMSLDGFMAPLVRPDDPKGERWMREWAQIQSWVFKQRFFRENLKLGDGGETGQDNRLLEQTFQRTGVSVMGKHMFDAGEHRWPEEAPFHTPVFVVTHQVREPWERPGGTTFYFVNDGIERALERAHEVAGGRDIRIAGGADLLRQYLSAGLLDELHIALTPALLGEGISLFAGIDASRIALEIVEALNSPLVTHLRYAVRRR